MPQFDVEASLLTAILHEQERLRRTFIPYQRQQRDPRPALFEEPTGYEFLDIAKARAALFTLRQNGLDICWSHPAYNNADELAQAGVVSQEELRMQYQHFQRRIDHDDSGNFYRVFSVTRIVLLCDQHYPADPGAVDDRYYDPEYALFGAVTERGGMLVRDGDGLDISRVPIVRRMLQPVFGAMSITPPIRHLFATTYREPDKVIQLLPDQF